ncbi:unnamed protein product [Meloidogyne enterolobii]|uniref:Uncharacterized protein n=1 Tax=Meloidogyne enterolobii TaxID=390850 RepID=A0ACB1AAI8_MELEN
MICLKDLFLYLSICISLPSVIVYILEIWTIILNKSLHNSFYALFCIRAFYGFVYILDSYYGYRIPNLFSYWFIAHPYSEWGLAIFDFLASYVFIGDNLSSFFIMLNRFIAIGWAFNYQKVRRFDELVSYTALYK